MKAVMIRSAQGFVVELIPQNDLERARLDAMTARIDPDVWYDAGIMADTGDIHIEPDGRYATSTMTVHIVTQWEV